MASCVKHGEWERRYFACPKCFEGGDVTKPRYCPTCKGAGTVKAQTYTHGPDDYEFDAECPACKGTGDSSRGRDEVMSFPVFEVKRLIVLLHAGGITTGNVVPITFTDAYGEEKMLLDVKRHTDAGAQILYDGPPNRRPVEGGADK